MFYCPYLDFTGDLANEVDLRQHFAARHPNDLLSTLRDECPPKCGRWGPQVTCKQRIGGHVDTKQCEEGDARQVQHDAAATSIWALEARFTAYGKKLERMEVFKYLRRFWAFYDNGAQVAMRSLKKARGVWTRVSRVLRWENALPRVCGMFYRSTVQAVLLFGSKTWELSPSAMKYLEGFHLKVVRWMTAMVPKRGTDVHGFIRR